VVAGFPIGPWISNSATSKWIAPRSDAGNGNADGNYTYRTTFDLTGLNPTSATITGWWATDNAGLDILINGKSTGISVPFSDGSGYSFQSQHAFTITEGFAPGINTLDFVVNNFPNSGNINPTGLRVELAGAAEAGSVPEPCTLLLIGSGLIGLAATRKRSKI
jgi:hypothetical protein